MRFRPAAAALALMIAGATTLEAQTHRTHLGPRVAYNFDFEELALGAQFSAPIAGFLEFYPSFDYFMVDTGTLWALNADLKLRVTGPELSWLYFGGGYNMTKRTTGGGSNNESGLNLMAGFEAFSGNVHPFAEIKAIVADETSTQIVFGLNFTLGGPR